MLFVVIAASPVIVAVIVIFPLTVLVPFVPVSMSFAFARLMVLRAVADDNGWPGSGKPLVMVTMEPAVHVATVYGKRSVYHPGRPDDPPKTVCVHGNEPSSFLKYEFIVGISGGRNLPYVHKVIIIERSIYIIKYLLGYRPPQPVAVNAVVVIGMRKSLRSSQCYKDAYA